MNKALITAVMGLSMLYAQSVSANNHGIVLADATSSAQSASAKTTGSNVKKTQHHAKKHHHASKHHSGKHHHHHVADASKHQHAADVGSKSGSRAHHHHKHQKHSTHKRHHNAHKHPHHYNRPQRGYHCPEGNCEESGMMDQRSYMRNQALMGSPDSQINDMDIINRDHAARAGRGR